MEIVLEALREAVGREHLLTGSDIEPRYLEDRCTPPRQGIPLAVARPGNTREVSRVLRACHAHRLPVVPQGGLTGLAGGATPTPGCLVLALERMTGIEEIDPASATLTAWAGTPLQAIQEAARAAGFFFPLDLGARGSCQIGGNIATNAGGNRVIRYGMTRELVLGLEVVLADGTVLTSLNKMLKNNTGYDLKHLFIGSEGTLGIVTRAVLRLHPAPESACTALCAVADYEHTLAFLRHAQAGLAGALSSFEMMWPDFYELVTVRVPGLTTPLPHGHGGYVLVESMGSSRLRDREQFETMLQGALDQALIAEAVIAQSGAESLSLWRIRDASGEMMQIVDFQAKFDVSIPTRDIGRFLEDTRSAIARRWPGAQAVAFGHIGDSNLHLNVRLDADGAEGATEELERIVYGNVRAWKGSVSAEHGIGTLKREFLGYSRTPEEIAVMRALKQALDPFGILNPGKLL